MPLKSSQACKMIIGLISLAFTSTPFAQYHELSGGDDLPDKTERMKDTAVSEYNSHYYTNFTNPSQIQADMVRKINNYYGNLRTCTPGNYNYTMYDLSETPYIYQTATIRGFVEGQCVVEIREDNLDVPDVSKSFVSCNISPNQLQNFTDQYGEALIKQGPTVNAQTKVNLTDINQCQIYESGAPQEIEKQEPSEVFTKKPPKFYQGDLQKDYPENQTDRSNEQNF